VHTLVDKATGIGEITGLVHAAGVSPSQASPETILHVDLYGTAVVLEEFGNVIARGGSGVVISSQSGHRLPALTIEQNKAWPLRLQTNCSTCPSSNSIRCRTRCTHISSRNVGTRSA
jgi:hypothetical protein